jgi:hypothetical protein
MRPFNAVVGFPAEELEISIIPSNQEDRPDFLEDVGTQQSRASVTPFHLLAFVHRCMLLGQDVRFVVS